MLTQAELPLIVKGVLAAQPIVDMHTHLYPPSFGHAGPDGMMLWGLDELVTYHYLVAEVFRAVPATKLPYAQFWAMPKSQQVTTFGSTCLWSAPHFRRPAGASSRRCRSSDSIPE